jgi:hypothetical protein
MWFSKLVLKFSFSKIEKKLDVPVFDVVAFDDTNTKLLANKM